jgi:hypothetical protein
MGKEEDPTPKTSKPTERPVQEQSQVEIDWDDSGMSSAYANVFNVTGTQEEIVLLFGESHLSDEQQRKVQLTNRILLNPFTAKKLHILLENAIQKHESKYGPLTAASPSRPGLLMPGPQERQSPHSIMQEPDRKANFLIQLIQDLGVLYEFERSIKMSPEKMLGNRFLLIVDKKDMGLAPDEKILGICERLNMPEDFLILFEENLSLANPVDFGFEADNGTCIYKVYLDFSLKWKSEAGTEVDKRKPYNMFLGFKWDAHNNAKKAVTKYTWHPFLSFEDIERKILNIFGRDKYSEPFETAKDLLEIAFRRTTQDRIYYLDVSEEESERRSFDINVYSANLQMKELYPLLLKVCRHYTISTQQFNNFYGLVESKRFGHLSGGIDREGKDFLTIYFGLEPIINAQDNRTPS